MAVPVEVEGRVRVGGQTVRVGPAIPEGIVTGVAYANLDAMGTNVFNFGYTPQSGIVQSAIYYDVDNEGLQVDLWLFFRPVGLQTDNGVFTLSDPDLLKTIDVIQFTSFRAATNGQVSTQNGLAIAYALPDDVHTIYAQLQARGALNIAAGALPMFSLGILAD